MAVIVYRLEHQAGAPRLYTATREANSKLSTSVESGDALVPGGDLSADWQELEALSQTLARRVSSCCGSVPVAQGMEWPGIRPLQGKMFKLISSCLLFTPAKKSEQFFTE